MFRFRAPNPVWTEESERGLQIPIGGSVDQFLSLLVTGETLNPKPETLNPKP